MMYEIEKLSKDSLEYYMKFSYPVYKKALESVSDESDFLAYGITFQYMPVGLGLVNLQNKPNAELLSLYIQEEHRGIGLSKLLLESILEELKQQKVPRIFGKYLSGKPSTKILENLLGRFEFKKKRTGLHFIYYTCASVRQIPWAKRIRPSKNLEVFAFEDMTEDDEKYYNEIIEDPTFPKELTIGEQDYPLDRKLSSGLRLNGRFIAWQSINKVSEKVYRLTSLYTNPKEKQSYALFPITRSMRELCKMPEDSIFIQTIPYKFENMINLAKNKFHKWSYQVCDGVIAGKEI